MLLSPRSALFFLALSAAASAQDPLSGLPLAFVENQGQWDARVSYAATRAGMTAFLTDDGLRLQLARVDREDDRIEGLNLFLTFEGASPDVRIVGREETSARRAYLLGDDAEDWTTDVPAYARVRYVGLHPGVDLGVREHGGRLEYDLLLAPGADPRGVVIRCAGIEGLGIEPDGSLALKTALGTVRQTPPVTWHVLPSGDRQPVESRFRIVDERRYGFEVDGIDADLELVIDPGLEWSTFLGDAGNDTVWSLAQDDAGRVTVAGWTLSTNFPTTPGAFQTSFGSPLTAVDAFVSRFDPSRTGQAQLVWSTLLGGDGGDAATSIALGPSGEVVVGGWTQSTDFPTASAYDATLDGNQDGFVVRLDPTGTSLIYGTYLGGSQNDRVNTLAVDAAGVIAVGGWSVSSDYPVTNGSTQQGGPTAADAVLTLFEPSLSGSAQLLYSTFFGGAGSDRISGLGLKDSGELIVAGSTSSTNLPMTPLSWDPVHNGGGDDGFVACIDPGQDLLLWSTFVGGSGTDRINAMALDASGRPTVGGFTSSTDLPTSAGAYDVTYNGGGCTPLDPPSWDAFVTRLDPMGVMLDYSTYLGDACNEGINGLAVDSGMVTVTGSVSSAGFPTTPGSFQPVFAGGAGSAGPYDAFVARLDPSLTGSDQLLYSTFLGGAAGYEYGYFSVALDATGAATVGGPTRSWDFPTTPGAYDATYNGNDDGFVARLDMLPVGAEKHGWSTPGCDGPLAVGVTGMPYLGNASFALTCTHAPLNASGFLFLGVGCVATPVYGAGAALFFDTTSPFLQLGVTSDGEGVSRVPAPLPNSPAWIGLSACIQFAWPDACAPGGYSASNALLVTLQ